MKNSIFTLSLILNIALSLVVASDFWKEKTSSSTSSQKLVSVAECLYGPDSQCDKSCTLEKVTDTNLCLAKTPQGEIFGEFSNDGTAKIKVKTYSGKSKELPAPFGFDETLKEYGNEEGYYIMATDRENENIATFDKVFYVNFDDTSFDVKPYISEPGIGFQTHGEYSWVYVSLKSPNDHLLTLRGLDEDGKVVDEFRFGDLLFARKDFEKDMFLNYGSQIIDSDSILLPFTKAGIAKGESYRRYIVSLGKRAVQVIQ